MVVSSADDDLGQDERGGHLVLEFPYGWVVGLPTVSVRDAGRPVARLRYPFDDDIRLSCDVHVRYFRMAARRETNGGQIPSWDSVLGQPRMELAQGDKIGLS